MAMKDSLVSQLKHKPIKIKSTQTMNKARLLLAIKASFALMTSTAVMAGGYKIPESSLNSTALSAAYVASAHGADAAYYNPANMAFNENISQIEGAVSYIVLPQATYTDNTAAAALFNSVSKREEFIMPTMHYSSKESNGLRYGLSMVSPGGLTKRWDTPYGKATSEEFSLQSVEINPSIAFKVNPQFALGAGVRVVYAKGKVISNSSDISTATGGAVPSVARDMKGDTFAYGFNLALSYKPTDELSIGLTYRSNIDLDIKGDAKLFANGAQVYNSSASVSVPLPASLNIAFAYDVLPSTTIELVYERTYWSAYDLLDFNYDFALSTVYGAAFGAAFDSPKDKKWNDVNSIRLGLTHRINNQFTLMAGYAHDESPVPNQTLGFELPSNDGKIYSIGFEYKLNKAQSVGMAFLHTKRKNVTVSGLPTNDSNINGTFSDISVNMLTLGYKHSF